MDVNRTISRMTAWLHGRSWPPSSVQVASDLAYAFFDVFSPFKALFFLNGILLSLAVWKHRFLNACTAAESKLELLPNTLSQDQRDAILSFIHDCGITTRVFTWTRRRFRRNIEACTKPLCSVFDAEQVRRITEMMSDQRWLNWIAMTTVIFAGGITATAAALFLIVVGTNAWVTFGLIVPWTLRWFFPMIRVASTNCFLHEKLGAETSKE